MENTVIVFYSRTGTTRQVAEQLAAQLGAEVHEVRDVRSRAGLAGDVRCVVDNLLQRHVAYAYDGRPLAAYDQVVLLTPIWIGRLAAPMRSFLADHGRVQGRLAVVCLMASRGAFNAIEEVARLSGKVPQPVLALLQRQVQTGEAREMLDGFVGQIAAAAQADGGARRAWLSPHEA